MSQMNGIAASDRGAQRAGAEERVLTPTCVVTPTVDAGLARALCGTDIVEARKTLRGLDPADRTRAFETPIGEQSLVPLLDAARRGAPHMLALFAGMGACLKAQTSRGLTAVHVALFYLQFETARTLLTQPKLRSALVDSARVTLKDVRDKLATLPQEADDAKLDEVALSITGGSAEMLRTTDRLAIYHAHIFDMKKSPVIHTAEGWNPESALEMRIRTLVGMYAANTPNAGLCDAIVREVGTLTDALHIERRVYTSTNIEDTGLARLALEHECEGIIAKLRDAIARGNSDLTYLLVPVGTPKHEMYLELEPVYVSGAPHFLLHFDNVGTGNDAHPTDGRRIYPLRTAVPATPAMMGRLQQLLVDLLAQRAKGEVKDVYDALYRWMTDITVELGIDAMEDPRPRESPAARQSAGNCTIANLDPSTDRRLGWYAEAFHDFERADVRRRMLKSINGADFESAERTARRARTGG